MENKLSASAENIPPPSTHIKPQEKSEPEKRLSMQTGEAAALRLMLAIETECRKTETLEQLQFLIANETRKLIKARQIFVFRKKINLKLETISGLSEINPNAQLVQDMKLLLDCLQGQYDLAEMQKFTKAGLSKLQNDALQAYPFGHFLWIPFLSRSNTVLGGMLLSKEDEWGQGESVIATRLAETYAHAMLLLLAEPESQTKKQVSWLRKNAFFIIIGALLFAELMIFPVHMDIRAPMEIVAHNPLIVTAPIDGNIEEILVNPSEPVHKGQKLVRLSDTVLTNKLDVARKEVLIAQARLKKISQLAFSHEEDRHDLRVAMADLELKKVELQFAKKMLERSIVTAEQDGIAVFANKQTLIGKPVTIGEQIMQIANPGEVNIRIDIPLSDALILKNNAEAKIYLDSDPLHTHKAYLKYSDYKAHETEKGNMAFRAIASFSDKNLAPPRIGNRGTAQIFGEKAPLGLYLFRRPIASLRQWIGL